MKEFCKLHNKFHSCEYIYSLQYKLINEQQKLDKRITKLKAGAMTMKNSSNQNKMKNLINNAKIKNENVKQQNPYKKSDYVMESSNSLQERMTALKAKVKDKNSSNSKIAKNTNYNSSNTTSITKVIALFKQKQQDK